MGCESRGIVPENVLVKENCVGFGTADADGGGDAFYPRGDGEGVHVFADSEEPERHFLD